MRVAGSAFAALDVQGYVVYHSISPGEAQLWRGEVRRVAREYGWKIRTGYKIETGTVWAARLDWAPQDPGTYEELMRRVGERIGP